MFLKISTEVGIEKIINVLKGKTSLFKYIKHFQRLIEQVHIQLSNLSANIILFEKEVHRALLRGTIPPEKFRRWAEKAKKVEHQACQVLQPKQKKGSISVDYEALKNLHCKIIHLLESSPCKDGHRYDLLIQPRRVVANDSLSPLKKTNLEKYMSHKKWTSEKSSKDEKVKRTKKIEQLPELEGKAQLRSSNKLLPGEEIKQAEAKSLDLLDEGKAQIHDQESILIFEGEKEKSISSKFKDKQNEGDDVLNSSSKAVESGLSKKSENVEEVEMSLSESVQEQHEDTQFPVTEVASILANPWERQTKMTNLELERNLPLEPVQNESYSSASASEGSLIGNNPEPSLTGFLPYLYEVEPEAERDQTAAEQSRSMDSTLEVTVSVAGELLNYIPTSLTDESSRAINDGQMSSSESVQEHPHNEVASLLTTHSETQPTMTNLEQERNLPLEPVQNESNYSASDGNLIGNNPEPSPTRILPSLDEVEPEAEKGQTAAEQSRSMDSPLKVTVSVAGELSNYMDLKFETLYGLSSSKGQNATDEFKYCDFTSEADNYHILIRKKTMMEVDQSNELEGDRSSLELHEIFKNTSVKLPEHLIWNRGVTSLTSPPEEEKWRQAFVMVLRDNSFHSLPQEPDCPNLVLLFLQRSRCLRKIPESFFRLMHSLRILDLSDSRMSSLPSSLFRLHKLQVLILRNCKFLDKLPNEVRGLVHLEVLDLFGTELNDVPDEVGDLIHLRHLQLTFYGTDDESEYAHLPLNFFSQNIISRLQSLEALSIVVHPEDIRWIRNAKVIIQDVGKLKNLCYLEFYFPKVEILEQFTEKSASWEQIRFNKFKFVVGQNVRRFVDRVSNDVENKFNEQNRCLRFVNGNNVPQTIIEVLNHVTAFYLDHHLVIRSLSELGITTSKELKFCTVRECPNVEVIIDDNNDEPTYPSLEHLGMHYLWKLKSISVNYPPKGSFCSLKSLIVDTCPRLEFIVYESMLQCLYNLEELVVEDCENVKEIVRTGDGMEKDVISALPSLRKVRLHYLPQLCRFWWKLEGNLEDPVPKGDFKALKSLDVQLCPKLELGSLPSMAEDLKVL